MNMIYVMLSWDEHEKSFIKSGRNDKSSRYTDIIMYDPRHEISSNVVYATS